MVSPTTKIKNPFPGLRPFREDEERFFFGRERQVDTMVNKLAATRFLAVVGTSGSGKSSLVNCGLRPALHRGFLARAGSTWRMAQFRPGSNPIQSLAQALAENGVLYADSNTAVPMEEIVETYLHQSAKGIVDAFRKARLPEGTNLFVVADQFEELFRYRKLETVTGQEVASGENAIAFVNLLLAAAAEPDCPIYVAITMRSDFLGDCSQFYGLPEAINQAQYLVPRMTRDERRASIAGPIGVGGAEISPVLLTRLVNDVGDNPDQLSILQHALHRTWACWETHGAQGPLELDHYAEIGTMSEALNQHADEAFDALASVEKKICEKLFKALTDLGTDARGIRRPLKLATLAKIAGSEEGAKAVLEHFRDPSRAFLMPPASEPVASETVIDISHESLMRVWKRLRFWAEDEAKSARQYRRLADTAALEKINQARLWRDPDLQSALDWQEDQSPTPTWANLYGGDFESAMDFLERSRSERDHELAEIIFTRRWKLFSKAILLVIAVIFVLGFETNFKWWSDKWGYKKDVSVVPVAELSQSLKAVRASSSIGNTARLFLTLACLMGPYLVAYFALTLLGKWLFRRLFFAKILREVARSSTKAAREQKLAEAAEEDPLVKFQTNYASFWRRLGAFVLDAGLFLLLFMGSAAFGIYNQRFLDTYFGNAGVVVLLIPFILAWLWQAVMLSSRRSATLGMLPMGTFTVDVKGRRLHFGRATARHFAKILSGLPLAIGFLLQPFAPKRQALHDLIAGSIVLVRPGKKVRWWWVALCVILALFELFVWTAFTAGFVQATIRGQ